MFNFYKLPSSILSLSVQITMGSTHLYSVSLSEPPTTVALMMDSLTIWNFLTVLSHISFYRLRFSFW